MYFVLLPLALILTIYGIYKIRIDVISTNWPSTKGKVSSRYVKKRGGGEDGPSYWVAYLVLSYFVAGQEYWTKKEATIRRRTKGRFTHRDGHTKEDVKAEALKRYPIDKQFPKPIFYNPTRPRQSVFEPGFQSWKLWYPVIGLVLYLISLIFFAGQSYALGQSPLFYIFLLIIIIIPLLIFLNFLLAYIGNKSRRESMI